MISIVVPTRNRPMSLTAVLQKIAEQSLHIDEVVIVDSSDIVVPIRLNPSWTFVLRHQTTKIKSAAVQRNIGIEFISEECKYLCFLDDDVLPGPQYLNELIRSLEIEGGVGISGIAMNPSTENKRREKPVGVFGKLQEFFKLDSDHDGILLKSGVNIPVRSLSGEIQEVEWLIGCSVWDFKAVAGLRFESDFMGQSLCEDVIFSLRASKRGKLFVNPNVHLIHLESEIGRPIGSEFWSMWVVNRKRLVEIASNRKSFKVEYHLANFGQFLTLIYVGVFLKKTSKFAAFGVLSGYVQLFKNRFAH